MADFEQWRASLQPINLDIVGDFAGKSLFCIHGEALLAHCVHSAGVDFDYGFQLLHAAHAVETLLAKLRDRGCVFHVLWFADESDICIPAQLQASCSLVSKYRLAREVLIQHLSRPVSFGDDNSTTLSYLFPGLKSESFRRYLDANTLRFFLGSSAHAGNESKQGGATPFGMLHRMSSAGYCVAFIEEIEFKSSKVYLPVVTPSAEMTPIHEQDHPHGHTDPPSATQPMLEAMKKLAALDAARDLTAREFISLSALVSVLSSPVDTGTGGETTDEIPRHKQAVALLLHLSALHHCSLEQRSFAKEGPVGGMNTASRFLTDFFDAARGGLASWLSGDFADREWDAFDMFDGRLLINISVWLKSNTALPSQFSPRVVQMTKLVDKLCNTDMSAALLSMLGQTDGATAISNPTVSQTGNQPAEMVPSVLPFNHPIVDQYLKDVRLRPDSDITESTVSGKIFQELQHWYNARKPLDPKYVAKPLDFKAARRHQRQMAGTMEYAASLTGASGKVLEPEIITVLEQTGSGKKKLPPPKHAAGAQKAKETGADKRAPKSNKQKALEHGDARKQEKLAILSRSVAAVWKERCMEFEKQPSLVNRFLKAEKYLVSLSSDHEQIIGSEVLLYLGNVLLQIQRSPQTPKSAVPALVAMLWSKIIDSRRLPLTEQVVKRIGVVEHALQAAFGPLTASPDIAKRPLSFEPVDIGGAKLVPAGSTPVEFLLEHCGPYLERSFDSAPDPRVPSFNPDAWQRKVLDAIDANRSVLAVAPTSAGKTFISFYAMKKVLQANDDDVLVYVAPTKALVNQIAAEVQARFSKKYGNLKGRSVWALYTRDYRINNPKGCQILVTVPSILQTLLLAPSNAKRAQDFSRRIKRIIFDEVHCIGQSDEGVIWEQLLLLAPCPIIALSATVANPQDFKLWLERAQAVKGFELEMIVHSSRYSELRKFIHDPPPAVSEFTGLAPVERINFPGLDAEVDAELGPGRSEGTPFLYVHPVGSLRRDWGSLNDASLESRDCLGLWRCMKKLENAEYALPSSLDPNNVFPAADAVRKSTVTQWEAALKAELAKWMADPRSPFDALRAQIRGERFAALARSHFHTIGENAPAIEGEIQQGTTTTGPLVSSRSHLALMTDLRARGALPAILFNYDRELCESIAHQILIPLEEAEDKYRATNPTWITKMEKYDRWVDSTQKGGKGPRARPANVDKDLGKAESQREAASREVSIWESFDPNAPLAQFSFADTTKASKEEVEERIRSIWSDSVHPWLIKALYRGIGVHHSGLNRQYRQVVEMLFRKGFLTVVVATGTLSMGINMPCKTVVFAGDSIHLSALNFRQASGRAGRRGFDVLGNVVFHNIAPHRALEIMSSKLPDLRGQFSTSVTLILRLFILLNGTDNSEFAASAVKALLTQNWLYLGGPDARMSIVHHLRFSIDYLRRQSLLSATGAPLNFSGLISHLHYTESAAFGFHALLRGGYLHQVCAAYSPSMSADRWNEMALELVLTLSHLFVRETCPNPKAALQPLPPSAQTILVRHNAEVINIYRDYARSYATQHLTNTPDNALPLTHHTIAPNTSELLTLPLPHLPPVTVRSPFSALSGLTDSHFASVHDLCSTARAGVSLEASVVPSVPLDLELPPSRKSNSYLLEFFKHGDTTLLERENGIRAADVWFRLKDFSVILASIVASMEEFMRPGGGGAGDLDLDLDGADGDSVHDEEGGAAAKDWGVEGKKGDVLGAGEQRKEGEVKEKTKKKKVVVDSWDDGETSESDSGPEEVSEDEDVVGSEQGQSLLKVYEALKRVKTEFDEKFLKMFA